MAGSDGKPRGMKEYVDLLERRVAVLEKRCVPAHPGGIGESAQRFHGGLVEQRQNPFRVPLPAEPPGSPTVEEAEDPFASQREAYTELFQDVAEKSVESLRDQPRRECSVVFSENGKAWFLVSSESRADEVMRNRPGATKHRMVELREGEGIAPVAMIELASRSLALQSECDALKDLSAHKEKAIELLQAQVVSLQKRNAWLSDDVNAEIKKRVAAETKYREYRETVRETEATND